MVPCTTLGAPEGAVVTQHGFAFDWWCTLYRCLCTGERGVGKTGKRLHYKGSIFHRIIPEFMCQAGVPLLRLMRELAK